MRRNRSCVQANTMRTLVANWRIKDVVKDCSESNAALGEQPLENLLVTDAARVLWRVEFRIDRSRVHDCGDETFKQTDLVRVWGIEFRREDDITIQCVEFFAPMVRADRERRVVRDGGLSERVVRSARSILCKEDLGGARVRFRRRTRARGP